jgi:hypothetical protein
MRKIYSSFEEINGDLQILKIKRELHYQKILSSADDLKEGLSPDRIIKNTFSLLIGQVRNSGGVQALLITSILKYFFIRKRSNKK